MSQIIRVLIIFIASTIALQAQTISGYVYDEAENLPLEGAMVYLDGTTYSANTNSKGFFSITTGKKLPAALVVSFVGFKTLRVDNPFDYGKPIKVLLTEDAIQMQELVVEGKTIFSRKQMLKVFREQFLGKSKAGLSCNIENEDDIRLRFDASTNTLYAEAAKPLRITNKRLQYNILFDLSVFEVNFSYKTLDAFNVTQSFVGGTTFFSDASEKGAADKKRKEAYQGSPAHFIKTMAGGDWAKEKYQLYVDSFWDDHAKYFHVSDTLDIKKISITPPPVKKSKLTIQQEWTAANNVEKKKSEKAQLRFTILYNKELQSFIVFDKGVLYVDADGLFWPLRELSFGGYMGTLKVGDMLPADYKPID